MQLASVRPGRRIDEQFPVERERPFVLAETDIRGGVAGSIIAIRRVELQQFFQLRDRLCMFVPPQQRDGIVEAGGPVVGRQGQYGLEQKIRIVEHIVRESNARQQSHGFDVVAVLQQVGAGHGLRRNQFAVRKHCGGGDDLGRQTLQGGDMAGRHLGVFMLTRHPKQRLQTAPAGRQRRIEVHAGEESIDGVGRIAQGHEAVSAFLIQAAEPRVEPLQALQNGERFGDPIEQPIAHRHHVEHVAVLRNRQAQGFGRAERRAELLVFDERADAQDFRLDGRCGSAWRGCLHCFHKKGGHLPAFDSTASDPCGLAAIQ
jgi:hypothetical protein